VGVSDPGDAPPAALPGPLVANDGDLGLVSASALLRSQPFTMAFASASVWLKVRSLVWSMTLKLGAESRWTKTMVPS